MRHNWTVAAAMLTGLLAGCAQWPGYQRPAVELPAAWTGVPAQGTAVTGERWWTVSGDPTLERLIDEALANNRDLVLAAARIDEARAILRATDSERAPSLDATGRSARTRTSESTGLPLTNVPSVLNTNRVLVNVAYEVDLWGRLRGASDAARAELLATGAARETVRITLVSQVIQSYLALLALDMQIDATRRAIEVRGRNVELQRQRYEAGLISFFNLRQLDAELAAARAQLPAIQQSRSSEEVVLSILLGRTARAIIDDAVEVRTDAGNLPVTVIPEGLPSDLLLRRPDIVEAEQHLIAANARIGVARAALFPRISLTGYLGSESESLGDLFSGPSLIWQLAFGLAQPIFQGGRLRAGIETVEARERQAVAQYQKTLQVAFGEVRDALSAQTRSREIYLAENERIDALSETLSLARIRFDNGLSSQLEVLDAERTLLQAELNRIDALRAQRAAVADLVRALGGGWTEVSGG